MNLYNLGLTGINAATARLNTTGHNINNVDTQGYNRQQVLVSSVGGSATSAGFYGRGVAVDGVTRQYSSYLYNQLVSARSTQSSYNSYLNEIGQINNLIGNSETGISPALKAFFSSVQAVASESGDAAARQEMIGQANSLVTQINETQEMLNRQRDEINIQVGTTVEQINSYVDRIAGLNEQITLAKASATPGQAPNDLLDQRDQLVSELNQLVGVRVVEQGSSINLTVGNGQVLLSGNHSYPLRAMTSANDPSRTVIAYELPAENGESTWVELDDTRLSGGRLGGLLAFRRESLDSVQNDLGRLALGLAHAFNTQHRQGLDQAGQPGGDFFTIAAPVAHASLSNQGSASAGGNAGLTAEVKDIQALQASDYRISYHAASGKYEIQRLSDGVKRSFDGDAGQVEIDGLSLNLPDATQPGAVEHGDSWLLQPTMNAAASLAVAVENPAEIAAADASGGAINNANALKLAQLQTDKVMGQGSLSISDTYLQIVNKVGVKTGEVTTASKAQDNLVTHRLTAQQEVSGVSLREEQVALMQYAEQYQASARLIDVASQMFDTLLSMK
ncbi:flagellar hook-associated protein 1 FlgK [Kerstersia gyiorum]|uniref:Flagellar hook-associated protein 1 n=1 Tax=Kerstersia gyiorum TaxID=206506 RepID=A0A4Q7MRU4_9BURK|nr:flagellar hook-associated protein FlgK [Kerstersia gyiorum]KAB0544469.1 flagellar hook-associated protein FlgK [Kerstersia gyiorum]RZS69602.1 flagellar hook-associated protein 1 FlgK [Kerstersia gyiorum]